MVGMKRIVLIALMVLGGCAAPPELSDPARWSRPGTTRQQTIQDLAACRVMSSASSGERFGRGVIPAAIESHRRNELVRDGMIAKGYTPVLP